MRAIEMLNELVKSDQYLATIISTGTWEVKYYKKNFIAIADSDNKRTIVIMAKISPHIGKDFEFKYFYEDIYIQYFDRVLTKFEIEELYKKFKKSRGKLLSIYYRRHRVKLSRKAKKIDDRARLKINLERQKYIINKLNELKKEYDKIKYKRKEQYKLKKKKLKELIADYEKILKDLREAYHRLLEELNMKEIKDVELLP